MNDALSPAAETIAITINHIEDNEPRVFTRRRRYASTNVGTRASMTVTRADRGNRHTIHWNVDQGRGWCKGWKCTRDDYETAIAFADEKWATLIAWLERTPSKAVPGENGAAAAFSAQVASMMR